MQKRGSNMTRRSDENFLEFKNRMIDSISPSFCAAKWYNATIWLGHGQTTSCHHPPGHNIDVSELEDNPSAIHNTKHKKLMRKYMQEGVRPAECEYCWKVEDIGRNNISDRVYKTEIYKDSDIMKASVADWQENTTLRTLEISFERTCNFACSYCNPAFSTTWVKDIKKLGPYRNIVSDGRGHFTDTSPWAEGYKNDEENPYIKAFWRWWESDLADNLEEIRITGGEPLMAPSVWKLFDWFKNNPERGKRMRFAMNSNLVPKKKETLDKLIEYSHYVPHFEVYTSNESIGLHSEYIRDGMKYEVWKQNLHRLITEGNLKALHIMMTINSLCLASITEFMDDMLDFKRKYGTRFPTMTLNLLRFPSFQSPAILPDDIKQFYKNKLSTWLTNKLEENEHSFEGVRLVSPMEQAHVERLIDYLDSVNTPHKNTAEKDKLYNDFKNFYYQYDIRRGKDFKKTFPKIFVDFFDSIEVPIPSKEEIKTNRYRRELNVIEISHGDPATVENYDDENIPRGWDTKNDELGKNL
jgi:organic radical activating enzyme